MEWLKQTAWSMLSRVPWLRRKIQRSLWQVRATRAYKQRSPYIPRLLEKYGVKASKNGGPKHIIFIVVDALRKNHLSLYGYDRETTPFLKSLSDKAAVFENALTASPWTYPSVGSILTGLYPHNHGGVHVNNPRDFPRHTPNKVSRNLLALPEVLATAGFHSYFQSAVSTAALTAVAWFNHSCVFFDEVKHHVNVLEKWLEKSRDKTTFIYFHLADLHVPIDVPMPYKETFGKITDISGLRNWRFYDNGHAGELDFERYKQNRCKLYDCALRFVDAQLARLFRYLKEAKILDSSLVFITADHGEEFWEHVELQRELFYEPHGVYGVGHGHNLFQELINVPLLCIGPGVTPGCYSHNVSLVDLAPTILEICGIEHQLALDGCNLFDCSNERGLFSEAVSHGYEKKAVVKNNWKLIHSEGDGVSLLFDLAKDPKERYNLAKANPEKLQELKAFLPKTEIKGEPLEVDKDIEEQLRHLGYM